MMRFKLFPEPPAEKARHDRMVLLVERMLELNTEKARCSAGLRPADAAHRVMLQSPELDRLEREIAATDSRMDELVYEHNGITDEERKIIEKA